MKTTQVYSNKQHFNIIDDLNIDITVQNNPYNMPLNSLFEMAARINPKRSFLFVSKLLGKHLAVDPNIPRISGATLSSMLMERVEGTSMLNTKLLLDALVNEKYISEAILYLNTRKCSLDKPTLFIGFAETATGLGHAMFDVFDTNASFIHTTRDRLNDMNSVFNFEEEHSHATSHLCYAIDKDLFNKAERIVLVDDEMTTGKTTLNLIRALNNVYPGKEYVMISLLDWRNDEQVKAYNIFQDELNIKVDTICLLKGTIECNNTQVNFNRGVSCGVSPIPTAKMETIYLPVEDKLSHTFVTEHGNINENHLYTHLTGRFGLNSNYKETFDKEINKFAEILKGKREFENTLCIGNGEFIYIPSLLAATMGKGVKYQSSTRSPIFAITDENYPINNLICFDNFYDSSVKNYLYNISPCKYDEVFIFLERDINDNNKITIKEKLERLGVKSVKFVTFK